MGRPKVTKEITRNVQGVPKKMGLLSSFELLDLEGVFLGVNKPIWLISRV